MRTISNGFLRAQRVDGNYEVFLSEKQITAYLLRIPDTFDKNDSHSDREWNVSVVSGQIAIES